MTLQSRIARLEAVTGGPRNIPAEIVAARTAPEPLLPLAELVEMTRNPNPAVARIGHARIRAGLFA